MFMMGSDPEFFVTNGDELKSAITLLPEFPKTNRKKLGCGGEVFYDNVGIEMNVVPANDAEQLVYNLQKLFLDVDQIIYNYDKKYRFAPIASGVFSESELNHKGAMEFGCDPEMCAYDLQIIPAPQPAEIGGFRSCGGHIHLGESQEGVGPLRVTPNSENDTINRDWPKIQVIRMMDIVVGLSSVMLDQDPTSASRRQLYGKAGSHRPKDYGVEYRSPGNFWLKSPRLVSLIFDLSQFAVHYVGSGLFEKNMCALNENPKYDQDQVRKAINQSDKALAGQLLESMVRPLISKILYRSIYHLSGTKFGSFYDEWNIR